MVWLSMTETANRGRGTIWFRLLLSILTENRDHNKNSWRFQMVPWVRYLTEEAKSNKDIAQAWIVKLVALKVIQPHVK